MDEIKITFSNKAYASRWWKNLKRQNPTHFAILNAIIEEISIKSGGDIVKKDIYEREPELHKFIKEREFNIIPSRGQLLVNNGNGIRHAKFAPSKSIAVIWEKIGEKIFITFDDHAPLAYHRAIAHLREIRLGRPSLPRRPRLTGRFFRKLREYKAGKHRKTMRRFDPKIKYYE